MSKKEIGIEIADIYLRFPEITDEEFEDVTDFIEDNHINYEGATDVFQVLKKRDENNNKKINDLQQRIDKTYNFIKKYQRKDEFLNLNEWQTRDLLEILGEDND